MTDDSRPGFNPGDLLALTDAQRELGVGRTLMYRLIADGEIAAITHGSRRWIERSEIAAYWNRRRDEADRTRAARAREAAKSRSTTSTTTPVGRRTSSAAAPTRVRPPAA